MNVFNVPDVPDCTVVTCCYDTSKFNSQALSVSEALKRFDGVLQLPVYLIIYTETCFYNEILEKRRSCGYENITIIYNIDIEKLWAFQYLQTVKENRKTYFPTADKRTSPESHLVILNKLDFVLRSIEENPFSTNKFCWLDAFLTLDNTMKICQDYEPNKLFKILNLQSEKFHIQILNVQDKKYKMPEHKREYYATYRYVICGGMFMCGKEIGTKILRRLKEICVETTKMGYGHGEEMMYLEVLDEFYDDIEKGYGDYGQIINNIIEPTCNHHYICYFIVNRYLQFGYYRECFDCCKKVLDSIKSNNINCFPEIHMKILYAYYKSAYFHKPELASEILSNIFSQYLVNPKINSAYRNEKSFYDKEFALCKSLKTRARLVVNVFGCATKEKYKQEILKMNETWVKRARDLDVVVLFFLGEEPTDLIDQNYIYIKNVKNDVESARYKQNYGLRYIHEHYDTDYVFTCGTDTYVNIDKMMKYLDQFDVKEELYIGGHGDTRWVGNREVYFHSGCGFILSNPVLNKLYPQLFNMDTKWRDVCRLNCVNYLFLACDVELAWMIDKNVKIIKDNERFYSCNHKGYAKNNTINCCGDKVNQHKATVFHYMTLVDFDEYHTIVRTMEGF